MFNFKNPFRRKQIGTYAGLVPGGEPSYAPRDYENFAKEAYMKNWVAYRAIDMRAKAVASVRWYVMKKDAKGKPEEIENSPWNLLLSRPNPQQSRQMFFYNLVSYWLLSGNSFIGRTRLSGGMNKGLVRELYCYRPSDVKIEIDSATNQIVRYIYQKSLSRQLVFDVDPVSQQCDMLHLKLFNPVEDIYGMSPIDPGGRSIDTSNSATDWNKGMLQNQARPGMLMMFERNLSDAQYNKLKKDLREHREGARNAGLSLILEGAKDAKPYGFNPTEMDFINGDRDTSRKIAAVFGVPGQLIGILGDSTYANYEQARQVFWEDTIIPDLNMIKEELNAWLFYNDKSGVYFDYDLDETPALEAKRESMWKRGNESKFITINEKREMVGYDAAEGGDVILVSTSEIPLDADLTVEEELPEDDQPTE
jgi:HK97 family phage portal protein